MSKSFFILLVMGVIFVVSGFILIFQFTEGIQEKYPDMVFFLEGEIKQGQLSSTPIELLEGDKFTITLVSQSDNIFFSVVGPDDSTLHETIFAHKLSFPFIAKTNGTHTINVGNLESRPITVDGFITEKPFEVDDFILNAGAGVIVGSVLILVGFTLVILSLVILSLKKFLFKKNKDTK